MKKAQISTTLNTQVIEVNGGIIEGTATSRLVIFYTYSSIIGLCFAGWIHIIIKHNL